MAARFAVTSGSVIRGLLITTLAVFLLGTMFVLGAYWSSKTPLAQQGDEPVDRVHPPIPPEALLREDLQPGKTYQMQCALNFNAKGRHEDWLVVKSSISIVYQASATIDRKILSNDGTTVVEERFFRKVSSTALETDVDLESLKLEFGFLGTGVELAAGFFSPQTIPYVAAGRKVAEEFELRDFVKAQGWHKPLIADLLHRNAQVRLLTYGGTLQGKRVRLTYDSNSARFPTVEFLGSEPPAPNHLTEQEQSFLAATIVPMNSVLFPDVRVKEGTSWPVDGRVFSGLLDPTLLATTQGEVILRRAKNVNYKGKDVAAIEVLSGELKFKEATKRQASLGSFRPQRGKLLFSNGVFLEGEFEGRGDLNIRSTDHIIAGAVTDVSPILRVAFQCVEVKQP